MSDLVSIGSSPAITCTAATSMSQAARLMGDAGIGVLVVVDDQQCVVGVATDRDIAVRGVGRDLPPETQVGSIMTQEISTVRRDTEVADAARQMAVRGCRRLPVVDDDGRILAVLSADDLYRVSSEVLAELDRVLGRGRTGNH